MIKSMLRKRGDIFPTGKLKPERAGTFSKYTVNPQLHPVSRELSGLRQDKGLGTRSQGRKEEQPKGQCYPDTLISLTSLGTGDKVCFPSVAPETSTGSNSQEALANVR